MGRTWGGDRVFFFLSGLKAIVTIVPRQIRAVVRFRLPVRTGETC